MKKYTLIVIFDAPESVEELQELISNGDLCPEDIMAQGEIESETVEEEE